MNYLIKNIINCFFNNRNRVTIVSVYKVIGFIALIFWQLSAYSQPSFETSTHRDTLCFDDNAEFVNTNIIPTNKYYWDFCAPDLSKNPSSGNITVPVGTLNGPAFISTIEAPEGVYAFVTNYTDGTLTRLFFSDINSPPTVVNLGTLSNQMPLFPEGINIVQDNDGNYYGFIVGGQDPDYKLVRLDFNNSLTNTPSIVYLTGTGIENYLNRPMGICLKKGPTEWFAFITNNASNTVTQLNFEFGLNNLPFPYQISDIELNSPIGIQIINEGGKWYGFVSNSGGNTSNNYFITRIKFLTELGGRISEYDIIKNNALNKPFDITFFQNCDKVYGYVLNSFTNAVQMIFSSLDVYPEFKSIAMDALSNPHGISELFRLNNTINALITHTSGSTNSISRIYYESPCDASYNLWSNKASPDVFKYPKTGEYNVSLEAQDVTGVKSYYCKPILVAPNPHYDMGPDTFSCPGKLIYLPPPPDSIGWVDSVSITTIKGIEKNINITFKRYINKYQCTFNDTIKVTNYFQTLNIGHDVDTLYGTPVTFDAGPNYNSYHWNTGDISQQITANKEGMYIVTVTSEQDCPQSDTIQLKYYIDVPNYITPNSSVNKRWYIPLLKNFPNADIRIYDRFGNLVAAYKGSDDGWDGTCKGRPLAADGYWYYIDLHNGDTVFKGSISIIR